MSWQMAALLLLGGSTVLLFIGMPVAFSFIAINLIGAILFLGGGGYALDYWRGTSPWFLLAGLLLGIVVGFYELAKTVWHR